MNVQTFKNDNEYQDSSNVDCIINKLDLNNPGAPVLDAHSSIPKLMHDYIACQALTNDSLLQFVGQQITAPIMVNGTEVSVRDQQATLSTIGSRQNLLNRQIEKTLHDHLKVQAGLESTLSQDIINLPPMGETFGVEAKVSDSGLRLITPFTGDGENNETELTIFLREVFTLSQTSNLTEAATVSVVIRKIGGSAQILLDDYVHSQGGPQSIKLKQIVGHLERKFIVQLSPLHSDAKLHNLSQGHLTYSQLQAQVQKLARLACRKEDEDKRATLIKLKEQNAFLLAISMNDRQVIHAENARRANDNLTPLNLDQMCNFLSGKYADSMNYETAYKVQETALPRGIADIPVNYVNKGSVPDKPGIRGQQIPQRRNFSRPRGQVKNNKYSQPSKGIQGGRKKFVTTIMANVPDNCCLFCGSNSHTFKQQECPYYGVELMQSPCRKCSVGAHPTILCKNKATPAQPWAERR